MWKKLAEKLLVFILVIFPIAAFSHPGKTDVRDGHKCWKNCVERGLEKGEYHLHDKNRNAIRLHQEEAPVASQPVEAEAEKPYKSIVVKDTEDQGDKAPDIVPAPKANVPVRDENSFPFYLLILAFIVLCLLILLALIRRKKKNDG